jgi:hypothetical protein
VLKSKLDETIIENSLIGGNLAEPKCFLFLEDLDSIVLSDSYCRIKIFNAKQMQQIKQIYTPNEGLLKNMIKIEDKYFALFKFEKEGNLKWEIQTLPSNFNDFDEWKGDTVLTLDRDEIKRVQLDKHDGKAIVVIEEKSRG